MIAICTSIAHSIGTKPLFLLLKASRSLIIKIIGIISTIGIISVNLYMIILNAAID
jgi:hypothetical protein